MSTSAISRRYARALVELAVARGELEAVGSGLAQLRAGLAAEAKARQLFESPTFPLVRKNALMAEVCNALGLNDTLRSFLGLLLAKDRLRYLDGIEDDYRRLADERSGFLRARVIAATSLDPGQQTALRQRLEASTGKSVTLAVEQDASLIGGVQVEIGGRMYDGSLKTQLQRIEESLVKG